MPTLLRDPTNCALFLDLDGTLLDIAPTPDDVLVPDRLVALLEALTRQMGGALAIISGRAIETIDRLLSPLAPVAAGAHGAEMRETPGGEIGWCAGPVDAALAAAVHRLAKPYGGVIVEIKPGSIAVHYRLALEAEAVISAGMERIVADGGEDLTLRRGRKVLEIVRRDISKGVALDRLMALPIFGGRRPVMIGDDIADLSAFDAARRHGGLGLRVAGEQFGAVEADFAGPAAVRAWLAALSWRLAA
jgi:trehalose 6-phosphate phosphatase